jgi:hypothetical protein
MNGGKKHATDAAAKTGICFGDSSERPELPKQNNYEIAEAMARQALTHLDPAKQADRCGTELIMSGSDCVELRFDWFGRPVGVSFSDGAVRNLWDGAEVPNWERIILLHYVGSIAPVWESLDLIGFNEVPSGSFYLGAFVRRSHRPLAEFFGRKPKALLEAGGIMGAVPAGLGDAAVAVKVLPKVTVTTIVYAADDEFPADAKLLFPASIVSYFCTEDIAVIGGLMTGRLIRAGRQVGGIGGF